MNFHPLLIPSIFFCQLSLIALISLTEDIALCVSFISDIILSPLRSMVPPIVEPDTTDVAAASPQTPVSPHTPETQEAWSPEWPELASFEGIEQEEVERTEWRNYELPLELELFEGDIPQEVQTILRDSLQLVRGNPIDSELVRIEVEHGEASPANQRRPSNASSAAISDTSGSEGRPRAPSTSSGTLNVPAKLTNGQPTVKMGPLGWIITYPEGEKPKKTKKLKEPKEDSGLIKFLKEKKAERAMGSVLTKFTRRAPLTKMTVNVQAAWKT